MKKGKQNLISLTAIGLVFSLSGLAFGNWAARQDTENFLTMASCSARIEEAYEEPPHVDPSQEVDKIVNVKNTGTADLLVRVSVEKAFGVRGQDRILIKDPALDPDLIEIAYNTEAWEQRPDGWFYYKDILRAGETTKEPLLRSYRLSPLAGSAYRGKDAQIAVCMEFTQAQKDAADLWNVSLKDLGIQWEDDYEKKDTEIIFLGSKAGFAVKADQTDLFAGFKNLLPGCGRSQNVIVRNDSEETAELFLHAKDGGQLPMTDSRRRLVDQLLKKYAQIEVREGTRILYRGAARGKDTQTSMYGDISLGTFAPGQSKTLQVTLSLSPQMDNRFQKLTGKVTWVFSARGEDGGLVQASAPQTGDNAQAGMWTALFLTSGAGLWAALWIERKNRRRMIDELSETDR